MTLRADLVILGGFLMHPTTTNMNIAVQYLGADTLTPGIVASVAEVRGRACACASGADIRDRGDSGSFSSPDPDPDPDENSL